MPDESEEFFTVPMLKAFRHSLETLIGEISVTIERMNEHKMEKLFVRRVKATQRIQRDIRTFMPMLDYAYRAVLYGDEEPSAKDRRKQRAAGRRKRATKAKAEK